jgi:glycosyltransferase involved in cell wall biosynthesis
MSNIELTIVTTAFNEVGNVDKFLQSCRQAITKLGVSAEILYFDDGSSDGTGDAVETYKHNHPEVSIQLVQHPYRMGITAAIQETYANSSGKYVCFMPADLESNPADDIPVLYAGLSEDIDGVVGWRKDRGDGKLLASKIYNLINWGLFGLRLHDMNWIKIIRREKLQGLRLRSDWHRFLIPILASRDCRFKEVVTQWHKRTYGRSNFGWRRFMVAISDLMTVKLLLSFSQRPMQFFGAGAALFLVTGSLPWFVSGGNGPLSFSQSIFSWVFIGLSMVWFAVGAAVEFLLDNGRK